MPFDGDRTYLSDLPDFVRNNFPVIGEKVKGNLTFTIKKDGYSVVSQETIDKCIESLDCAFGYENLLLEGEARQEYWPDNQMTLTLQDIRYGIMDNAFNIKTAFAESRCVKTISAAIVHEIVEMWREDQGLKGEGAQMMIEYLLCGDDRLSFKGWCEEVGRDNESHQIGWDKVVSYVGFETEDKLGLYGKLQDWKKTMSEEERVGFIKEKLLNWIQV